MPSPRAVLCDIIDYKLDPNKEHKRTSTNGRLAGLPTSTSTNSQSVKLALKKLVEKPKEDVDNVNGKVVEDTTDSKPTEIVEPIKSSVKPSKKEKQPKVAVQSADSDKKD